MAEVTKSLRYRINVSQTSTGKKSFECTVEFEQITDGLINLDVNRDTTLTLSDALVAELEKRYPVEVKEK